MGSGRQEKGFTYIALLALIAVWSISLCLTVEVFEKKRQREIHTQLVWVAKQYTHAIESYYYSASADKRKLPNTLDELLEDKRFYPPARHLRSIYIDETNSGFDLKPIQTDQGLIGVKTFFQASDLKGKSFLANLKNIQGEN